MEDRWRRVEEILVASWELPAPERDGYLVARASGDAELLAELRELSAAHEAANQWSAEHPPAGPQAPLPMIGPYRIERLIARGGMGAVYLAHRADGQFQQQVALKVIGLPFDLEPFRERFRRERQILAGLSHPNIAHLLDGGTTEAGDLYLAMEFINGVAIGQYAKALPLAERLRLFREVCAGVQYAHQRLVIHRDIKPSNILVNTEGIPKLLDFGAAKLLAETDAAEQTRMGMMTVAYASPEQLRGEPASTLSDVFSLGVLLYELVTGAHAFGSDVVSRAIDAARGSDEATLPQHLPGDLDRVARKALALDPADRYSSVEQLSEDIRRYQAAEPVMAHPPGAGYRAGKFVRRHAVGVALASIFVLALAGATAFSLREARVAQTEATRAQAVNQFLNTLFELPFADTASHHDMTFRELLELAEKRVTPALGQDPATAADVDLVLGAGLETLQAREQAERLFERALDRARTSGDIPRQAAALSWLGSVAYQSGDIAQAWTKALESLGLWSRARSRFPIRDAVFVLAQAGQLLEYIRPSDPIHRQYLEEAVRLERRYPARVEDSLRTLALQSLAESYLNNQANPEQGYRDAYPLLQEAVAIDRKDPLLGGQLIGSLQSWGRVNRFLGHYDRDEAAQREAYQQLVKLMGPEHPRTASQRAIWAISLAGVGKIQESYQESQAALATMRQAYPVAGTFQLWTNTAAAAWGACLTGRFTECDTLAREAMHTLGTNPAPTDPRMFEAKTYLALALLGEGNPTAARPLLEQTVPYYRSRNRQGLLRTKLEEAYAKLGGG